MKTLIKSLAFPLFLFLLLSSFELIVEDSIQVWTERTLTIPTVTQQKEFIEIFEKEQGTINALNLINNLEFHLKGETSYWLYDLKSTFYIKTYDYSNAAKSQLKALNQAKKEGNEKLQLEASIKLGKYYSLLENYEATIATLSASLKNNALDNKTKINILQLLGNAQRNLKYFGKSKQHFKSALDIAVSNNETLLAAEISNQLGLIASELEELDEAMTYHNTALNIHLSENQTSKEIANDYAYLADILLKLGDFETASRYNNNAREIWNEENNNFELAKTYQFESNILILLNKKSQAILAANQANTLLKKVKGHPEKYLTYQLLAKNFSDLGKYELAFENQLTAAKYRNEFHDADLKKTLAEINKRYESEMHTAAQVNRIEKLESDKKIAAYFRWFLIACLLAIAGIAIVLAKNYALKKLDNDELEAKNYEIELQNIQIKKRTKELEISNENLNRANLKMAREMAAREKIQKNVFNRDQFLTIIGDKIRTPLNAIMGLSNLFLEEKISDNQADYIRSIQYSANEMSVYFNDILEYANIDSGKISLAKTKISAKDLLKEIITRVEKPSQVNQIKFEHHISEDIPDFMIGDSVRFRQTFDNLLGFILKKLKHGSFNLNASYDNSEPRDPLLEITINYSGKLLSPQNVAHLQRSNKQGFGGNYLEHKEIFNLFIAKRLVELQNGNFEISTGKNQFFKILLPFKLPENSKKNRMNAMENFKGKNVLIVEDNKINQLVVSNMLHKAGMNIKTADNGEEAVEILRTHRDIDLILMDLQMPVMDGYKATTIIRGMQDETISKTPIIALTASSFLNKSEKAKLFGMDAHVGKPFGEEDLFEKIQFCLNKNNSQGEGS